MNKRMHELINEAFIATTDGKLSPINTVANVERFAELIVRECVDIAYEYDAPKMSGPGMIIAGEIKTHFGIEE